MFESIKDPHVLLKKASTEYYEHEFNKAVLTLKKAYKVAKKYGWTLNIESYLRLPHYLSKAGRPEEGWKYYLELLRSDIYTEWLDIEKMQKSEVFKSMHWYMKQNGNPDKSIKYGIFSHIYELTGLLMQERYNELEYNSRVDYIEKRLKYFLQKTTHKDKMEQFKTLIIKYQDQIPLGSLDDLNDDIIELLNS